jgi:hypothetical protein
MGLTGTNSVAACLMARRIQSSIPGAVVRVQGEGMDCRVEYELPDAAGGTVRDYREWLALRTRGAVV